MQRIERLSGDFPLFMQVFSKLRESEFIVRMSPGACSLDDMRKLLSVFVLATVFGLPASAQADDFCVGSHPLCPDGATSLPGNIVGFTDALVGTDNNPDSDRIYVASGSYAIVSGTSWSFAAPVEIHGAGVGSTVFTGSASNQDLLNMDFVGASVFEGFTLNVLGAPSDTNALVVQGGEVRNFEVNDQTGGTATNLVAVDLSDSATARDFTVNMSDNGDAVKAFDNAVTIDQARLNGTGAATADGVAVSNIPSETVTVTRSAINNFSNGMNVQSGTVVVHDTAIALGTGSRGVYAYQEDQVANTINIDLDRVTIFGNFGNQIAVAFGADYPGEVVDASIRNSIVHMPFDPSTAIRCTRDNGGDVTQVHENIAYEDEKSIEPIQNCDTTFPTFWIDTDVDVPTFVDADNGDLRHAAGSPMIDRLDGSAIAPGALDAAGVNRLADGDSDCTTKLDVGAYEFQPVSAPNCDPPPATPPTTLPLATAKLTTRAKKAFVRSRSGFRKRTNPRATAFGVTYKNAQIARFELEQARTGFRKGRRCLSKGKGRRCTYFKKLNGIQRQDVYDGEIFYTFGGRFNGKRLKPGTYRVLITPFGEGGTVGTPIRVQFKLR